MGPFLEQLITGFVMVFLACALNNMDPGLRRYDDSVFPTGIQCA